MKPVLAVLGIGTVVLGLFGITRIAWFGWLEIIVGIAALLAASASTTKTKDYGGVGLGIATLVLWIVALAIGAPAWLTWLTFLFGMAYVLSSPIVTRGSLPPGRGHGPTFPR
jgi:hypothetical protein